MGEALFMEAVLVAQVIGGLRSKLQNFRGKLQEEETLNQRCVR